MTIRVPHPKPSAEDLSLAFLVGQALVDVDATAWPLCQFRFARGDILSTSGLWRVIADGRIIVTSDDHEHLFGLSEAVDAPARARNAIATALIHDVSLGDDTGDLRLQFANGQRLECIASSCGYENWEIRKLNGDVLVAHASGRLTFFAGAA